MHFCFYPNHDYGCRTKAGCKRLGTMMTAIETAKRQGRSVLKFLVALFTMDTNGAPTSDVYAAVKGRDAENLSENLVERAVLSQGPQARERVLRHVGKLIVCFFLSTPRDHARWFGV